MIIGEVCLLTNDVIRLADFYKQLLGIDNVSNDTVHQTLIAEETMLTIYNDGTHKTDNNLNICLAFTVQDLNCEYVRLKELGADIITEPKKQPWGAYNMSLYDPDRNIIYLRQLI
ncbi:VOC family protein [Anaeromicropila herbilytica]|uniref:VOC domain-containing protein n=1 Tax=Anaeromicropila herbilytica TaxID=2785025 RepID=A0A7R7EKJ4_9FIRM|nr:VOC family protein [Anaeromicropila herbilytica]BCN30820.1 hypothetical protein bsdtb5_21150 [Anaeromicropila herbilytica]